jgi:hypothetical protein
MVKCQVKFIDVHPSTLNAIKQTVLPALSSSVINVRYQGDSNANANYITNICTLRTPMILGVSSIVTFDRDNHCKIVLENCTPSDVMIERGDLIGLIEIKEEELILIPLTDEVIAWVCSEIQQKIPKVKKKTWSRQEIVKKCLLQVPKEF